MPFCDSYVVAPGDNLTRIAKARGYKGTSAIRAFPQNHARFSTPGSENLIRAGERIFVPWHPNVLRKIIATSEYLIEQVAEQARRLMEEQKSDAEKLESFLKMIDAVNFIASIQVEIGSLIAESAQHGTMSTSAVLEWLAEAKISQAREIATLVIPEPTRPRRDFRFFVRHSLGPWTPSFWASVYTAIKTRDLDTYLYGADATSYRVRMQIRDQANRDIEKLRARMQAARIQLSMPFYAGEL